MSEKILRINLAELNTIRVKIGDVTAEMPLDGQVVTEYAKNEAYGRLNESDRHKLIGLVVKMQEAKQILETIGIEFVLPGE